MWLITLILGSVLILTFNYWIRSSVTNDWKKRGIPHSNTSPLYRILEFLLTKKGLLDIMINDYNKFQGHKFIGYFQFFTPSIMIRDADLIHRICIQDFSHFVDRNIPIAEQDLFAESLGSVTGDRWRTLRHKMTPSFTSGKLKTMFDPIRECCVEVTSYINKKDGKPIEARGFMFKFVVNVIGNVCFGMKVDALNEENETNNDFLNASKSFFKPSFFLVLKFMITMFMPNIKKYIKIRLTDCNIDKFFRNLTKEMIAHRKKSKEVRNDFLQLMINQKNKEELTGLSRPRNKRKTNQIEEVSDEIEENELLEQLQYICDGSDSYKSQKVFSDDCIASQSFIFISAGSETTAASLSFVLFELAANPKLQKQVQEEIDSVTSKHRFTYQAIDNMRYTEQFIYESMRMHTSSAFISRVCTKRYNIPGTDVVLEKGTLVTLPVIGLMRDPHYFPEPEKFDPDRFEDLDSIHPGAYLAFGAGPRMCIAKHLAMMEMKMLLATILLSFTIKLSPKTKLPIKLKKASVFQHVDGGIWIQFEERIKK